MTEYGSESVGFPVVIRRPEVVEGQRVANGCRMLISDHGKVVCAPRVGLTALQAQQRCVVQAGCIGSWACRWGKTGEQVETVDG